MKKSRSLRWLEELLWLATKVGQAAFNTFLHFTFSLPICLSRRRYACWRFAFRRSRCFGISWGLSGVVDTRLASLVLGWMVDFECPKLKFLLKGSQQVLYGFFLSQRRRFLRRRLARSSARCSRMWGTGWLVRRGWLRQGEGTGFVK